MCVRVCVCARVFVLVCVQYADYDFQWSVSKIYSVQSEAEIGMSVVAREAADSGIKQCQKLDTKQDLQRFMQDFGNYFYPPPEFQFIPAKKEEVGDIIEVLIGTRCAGYGWCPVHLIYK